MICVLGRQPELGLAELEALYGHKNVRPLGETCAAVDVSVDFKRLGGSLKIAEQLVSIPSTQPKNVFKELAELLPDIIKDLPPEGKVTLALSAYGLDISPFKLSGEALKLKKVLRAAGRSARVVPNETTALSSAQTYHNRLATEKGIEFLLVVNGSETVIGRVVDVQNIDAYRIRDRNRPKRDAFVGMLPPKLAQTIVNLAVGESKTDHLLDPFCGTGVILQEALLTGMAVRGSDISPKMIEYTKANLDWLVKLHNLRSAHYDLTVADATSHNWKFDAPVAVATEAYLGQPLGGQTPSPEKIREIIHDTNDIIRGFLKNIAGQLKPGSRLCVAVPAWFVDDKEYHLPVIDDLNSLGFEQIRFSATDKLIYRRHGQVTARELLVLKRI